MVAPEAQQPDAVERNGQPSQRQQHGYGHAYEVEQQRKAGYDVGAMGQGSYFR